MPDSIEIAHLPEREGVSINVSERMRLLVPDHFLEGADGLVLGDLDREDAIRIVTVTEDPTVELEFAGHVVLHYWEEIA